jgi:putative endonuclease
MKEHNYYVYILASHKRGTIYIGVTNNLKRRMYSHRNETFKGFTSEYKVKHLVYYEHTTDVNSAIQREKHIKKWNRSWKIRLIEEKNPNWNDLYYFL